VIKCPKCKNTIKEPDKVLKNCVFEIKAYTCNVCGHQFKETKEMVFN